MENYTSEYPEGFDPMQTPVDEFSGKWFSPGDRVVTSAGLSGTVVDWSALEYFPVNGISAPHHPVRFDQHSPGCYDVGLIAEDCLRASQENFEGFDL